MAKERRAPPMEAKADELINEGESQPASRSALAHRTVHPPRHLPPGSGKQGTALINRRPWQGPQPRRQRMPLA